MCELPLLLSFFFRFVEGIEAGDTLKDKLRYGDYRLLEREKKEKKENFVTSLAR